MPSLFESISIPILEAFALGVPVCTSNITSIPDQVGDAALLFDPNDVGDINDKIMLLLGDDLLREKLGKRGNKRIKDFDFSKFNSDWRSLLAGPICSE